MKAMWKFVDPIIKSWQKNIVPLESYVPNIATISEKATQNFEKYLEKNNISRELVVVGLGKMGANMVRRLLDKNWQVYGYNRSQDVVPELEQKGMKNLLSLDEIKNCFSSKPRVVWLMLPAGEVIDSILFDKKNGIVNYLNKGDIVIDGGNSFYKDALRRSKKLKSFGIDYIDVGTSGGPGGARNGACLMIGGEERVYKKLEPLFKDFAADSSYQFFEGVGAGHFVKMVHNGIEYGMMQAIAEGYAILKKAKFKLDLKDVTTIYSRGSVIESRLITWLGKALELHGPDLKKVPGKVGYTGEGEWTVKTAKEMKLKAKIIEESFRFRVRSQKAPDYTGKILMALREQFGGHKK
jgi:6-phosphogluconate dehydrogenase